MKSLFRLILVLLMSGCSQTVQFQINGTVPINYNGAVRLSQIGSSYFDSKIDTIRNGAFKFEGIITSPEQFMLIYEEDGPKGTFESFSFFLEPSDKVKITLYPDSIKKSIIKGSKLASKFIDLENTVQKTFPLNDLRIQYENALAINDTIGQEKIMLEADSINIEIVNYKLNYISENPNSYISAYLLYSLYPRQEPEITKQYFEKLNSKLADSKYYNRVEAYLSLLPGNPYKDFSLTDGKGKNYVFSELANNKVVLIDFWASWCQPCRNQNAKLATLYDEFHKFGFEIVGVSIDRDTSVFLNTIVEDNMKWVNLLDRTKEEPIHKIYETGSIPSNILIDKNGIIQYRDVSIEDMELTIKELLKQ